MNANGDAKAKSEHVALVMGASRGVGRGVAQALADSGLAVYATGRNIAQSDLPNNIVRIPEPNCQIPLQGSCPMSYDIHIVCISFGDLCA
jgi:NAD(P)-dependent dehydrogenase (short-subunit alcohol dehydrogenase family)